MLKTATEFDFSGLESATDFTMFSFAKHLKENKIPFKFEDLSLNGCTNISVWALHYLTSINNKALLDLASLKLDVSVLKS